MERSVSRELGCPLFILDSNIEHLKDIKGVPCCTLLPFLPPDNEKFLKCWRCLEHSSVRSQRVRLFLLLKVKGCIGVRQQAEFVNKCHIGRDDVTV